MNETSDMRRLFLKLRHFKTNWFSIRFFYNMAHIRQAISAALRRNRFSKTTQIFTESMLRKYCSEKRTIGDTITSATDSGRRPAGDSSRKKGNGPFVANQRHFEKSFLAQSTCNSSCPYFFIYPDRNLKLLEIEYSVSTVKWVDHPFEVISFVKALLWLCIHTQSQTPKHV